MRTAILVCASCCALGGAFLGHRAASTPPATKSVPAFEGTSARLPLAFETNLGQTDASVRFVARGGRGTVFVRPADAVLAVRGAAVAMRLEGARADAEVAGVEELPGRANYFLGADPSAWITSVPTWRQVESRDVWPGIDVVWRGEDGRLEYDFVVAPGADPGAIGIAFDGADSLRLDPATGDLLVRAGETELRQGRPTVYQELAAGRSPVEGRFVLRGGTRAGFEVEGYDATRPLVIDPPLAWEGFVAGHGGYAEEQARSIVADAAGDVYVAGGTSSFSFPTVLGPEPLTATGRSRPARNNAFLTKIDAAGHSVLFQTYFGGTHADLATGVAVDASGNAYVCGTTWSGDFPTTPGALDARGDGRLVGLSLRNPDGFVIRFDTNGSAIGFSTFLGGIGNEDVRAIALDAAGRAVVVGSSDWDLPASHETGPTAFQPVRPGGTDAFVLWLEKDGSAIHTSTWIGGTSFDFATSVVADPSGGVVVTGGAFSPSVDGATPIRAHSGGYDLFVAKLSTAAELDWFTFLGGSGSEPGFYASVDLDAEGRVLVATTTDSADFPTTPGAFDRVFHGGTSYGTDAAVARLTADGVLDWATYLGGADDEYPVALAVDRTSGACLVAGGTKSADFPTLDATQAAHAGDSDGFVAALDATGSSLSFATFHGGAAADWLECVCPAPGGAVCVAGEGFSERLGTATSFQPRSSRNLDVDVIVARYAPGGQPADTIELVPQKGVALDRPRAVLRVSGRLSFRAGASDGAFDPSTESLTLTMGNRLDPHVLFVAPGEGWKSLNGRHTWRTPGRRNPHLQVTIDTRKGTFSIVAKQFSFPTALTDDVFLSLAAGDDAGTDERQWRRRGKSRLLLK